MWHASVVAGLRDELFGLLLVSAVAGVMLVLAGQWAELFCLVVVSVVAGARLSRAGADSSDPSGLEPGAVVTGWRSIGNVAADRLAKIFGGDCDSDSDDVYAQLVQMQAEQEQSDKKLRALMADHAFVTQELQERIARLEYQVDNTCLDSPQRTDSPRRMRRCASCPTPSFDAVNA